MSEVKQAPRKEGKVQVFRFGRSVWIPEEEYIEDNLMYHAMIHVLSVTAEKIDYLEDRGYFFQRLKQTMKSFRDEVLKHTGTQVALMHQMGSGTFHNKTQKDYDELIDFISGAKPAKITYLMKMIRESEDLANFDEKQLAEAIESGEIEVEPENEGKSGIFKNNQDNE